MTSKTATACPLDRITHITLITSGYRRPGPHLRLTADRPVMSGIHPQGVAGFAGSRGAGHSLFGNRAESAAGRDRSMEMRAEIVINADTDDARVVVGERFGQISEWASATTGSSMDGLPGVDQVRTCHVAGFGPLGPGVVREPLVGFDPEARSLSYEAAERMPGFIVHAVNR